MSNKEAYWDEIFKCYKASGLSRSVFCKQNNLSNNQFHYRWSKHNKALKEQRLPEQFEIVSVLSSKPQIPALATTINMKVYLPNQIRCDIRVDLNGVSSLLTQLVQLC